VLHSIKNKEAYTAPYDRSVFYFFALLFFFIPYEKLTMPTLYDVLLNIIILFLIFYEPFIKVFELEYSYYKCFLRIFSAINITVLIYVIKYKPFAFLNKAPLENIIPCLFYFTGYNFISSLVQIYSLVQEPREEAKKKINKKKRPKRPKKNRGKSIFVI
jgi:hypothetical protein